MNPVKPALDQLDAIIDNVEQSLNLNNPEKANGSATTKPTTEVDANNSSETKAPGENSNKESVDNMKKKKEKKKKGPKPETTPKLPPEQSQFLQCDLKIGKIINISNHPEASGLYVLKVLYNENDERTVCAGLRNFLKEDELLNRYVITICNLKPRKLRGIESQAMILAGSIKSGEDKEKVIPLNPPSNINCNSGEIIHCQSFKHLNRTVEDGKFVSGKNWDKVVSRLSVLNGQACYDGHPLIINDQPIVCDLPDGSEIH